MEGKSQARREIALGECMRPGSRWSSSVALHCGQRGGSELGVMVLGAATEAVAAAADVAADAGADV